MEISFGETQVRFFTCCVDQACKQNTPCCVPPFSPGTLWIQLALTGWSPPHVPKMYQIKIKSWRGASDPSGLTPISVFSFQYYAESHGVIYVIDSTDEERLSESKRAFGKYSVNKIDLKGCIKWNCNARRSLWLHPCVQIICARHLCNFQNWLNLILFLSFVEKMITSEALEGVPILVLANKQDVEVKYSRFT